MGEQKMNLGNRSDVSFDGFEVDDDIEQPAGDENQEGDQKPETKENADAKADADKGGENKKEEKKKDQGDPKGDGKGDDKNKKADEDEDFKDDGEEPKERQKKFNNRAAQIRIAKKEAKNNKGSGNKKDEGSDDSDDDDIDDDDIEDDDDSTISEKDKKVLDKYFKATGLDKKILELNNKVSTVDDEKEFDKFLNNPENKYFAPFKDKIWRYSQTESRKNLPFETIALEVVGMQGILKIAAKMVEEANKKAINNSSGNGSGAKGSDSSKLLPGADKPIDEMSKEEFDAFLAKTRQSNA